LCDDTTVPTTVQICILQGASLSKRSFAVGF
jgi:hypothetical protein